MVSLLEAGWTAAAADRRHSGGSLRSWKLQFVHPTRNLPACLRPRPPDDSCMGCRSVNSVSGRLRKAEVGGVGSSKPAWVT